MNIEISDLFGAMVNMVEKQKRADDTNSYDDLYLKIASVVGTIEEALNFDK